MAPSRKQACSPKSSIWESSHLDNILIHAHDLFELSKRYSKRQEAMKEARFRYYDWENEDELLAQYVTSDRIRDVIFVRDGQKCIIANDIGIHKGNCYSWYKSVRGDVGRRHSVIPHRKLEHIDRTSKNRMAFNKGNRHRSEGEWHLPKSHDRHISKFPREILEEILGHLVQIPDAAIVPLVVTCNWKKLFSGAPRFTIRKDDRNIDPYTMTEVGTLTETEDGVLMVLRNVHQSRLDATCLRVCKSWNNIGGSLIYRFNCYSFTTNNPTFHGSPPTFIGKELWRPSPNKPYLLDIDESPRIFNSRIDRGIRNIEQQVKIKKLVGWVYHDPFLRFLYTIGTKNTALLRTLEFSGEVRCHQCQRGHFCDDCLLESLRVYIPIINKLCPKVQMLMLHIREDSEANDGSFAEKLQRFFKNDLRKLKFVTELVVRYVPSRDNPTPATTVSRLVDSTNEYFQKRNSGQTIDGVATDL